MAGKLVFVLIITIYRVLLDKLYVSTISPFFSYDSLIINRSESVYVFSWGILLILTWCVYPFLKKETSFISFVVAMLFLFKVIPFTSFIACNAQPWEFIVLQTIYWSLIFVLLRVVPSFRIPYLGKNTLFINGVTFIFVAVIVFLSGYYAHFRLHFSLMDVYDLRREARDYDIPIVLGYIHSAAAKVLPLLLIFYVGQKKRVIVLFIVLAILLSFGVNGMKSTFLNLFLCLGLYYLHSKYLLSKLSIGLIFLCIVALFEFSFLGSYFISDILIRRILYIPSLLDTYYYNYAIEYGPLYFNPVVNKTDIAYVIGGFWRTSRTCANNGLFSDAYINLGIWGVFIYPFVYTIFFKYVESIFRGKDYGITFYAAFIITYNMISSFFTVCLLTHGMFILCLIVMFMPSITNAPQRKIVPHL